MVLLTLGLACTAGGTDDTAAVPPPWTDLAPRALSPLQPLLDAPLSGHTLPSRLALLSSQPHAFVLDEGAGQVHVFDDRYRHDGASTCVGTQAWPRFEVDERQQGDCPEGEVSLSRGAMTPPGELYGQAVDEDGLQLHVWAGDRLHTASADLLHPSPWEYLRLDDGVVTAVPEPVTGAALVAGGGSLWFGSDRWLGRVDADGTLVQEWVLPGVVGDLAWSGEQLWVATDAGVWGPDVDRVNGISARRLAADGDGGVWFVDADTEQAVHLSSSGAASAWEVPGATGLLALDPSTDRLAVSVDTGVALYEDRAVLALAALGDVRDVAVNAHHEIVVLHAEGLQIFGDETALGVSDPLALIIAGFVEQPRSPEQDMPCLGDGDTISAHLAVAVRNRRLLDDLPAGLALGITPQMGRRALACGQVHDLYAVGDGDRVEVGVLNHERPDDTCILDPECHRNFLGTQHTDVAATGLVPGWFSGLMIHEDLGADWVANLVAIGVTDTYLHFSLSVLPDIDHGDDPRAKQPYPPRVAGMTTPLVGSAQAGLFESDGGGDLRLLAGNSLAAFRLSKCPNMLLWECNALPGDEVEPLLRPEDIEVLRVLLFRALSTGSGPGHAWSFHLPDVGSWDYTTDCSVSDGVWTGDDCQGAHLQGWLLDVHASYVASGLVSWDLPRELAWPE